MRRCPVPTLTINCDANGIGVRVVNSWRDGNGAGRQFVAYVQRHNGVGLWKSSEQASFDHPFRPPDRLFRGLADQDQRPMPGVFAARHDFRRSEQRCHMHIVTTGMHHRHVAACIILGMYFAGVGKTRTFLDRQRVEFGAQHNDWTITVLQDRDNSRATEVFCDVVPCSFQFPGQLGGCFCLMSRQFGMLMQIQVQRVRVGINAINFFWR